MYLPALDIFLKVVECGSFSKAAKELYLTHTAIIKQMNSLEEILKVQLFIRSPQGIKITKAGEVLKQKIEELKVITNHMVQEVQQVDNQKELIVGTSTLYPCKSFMDLWDQIQKDYPSFQLKIQSFQDDQHRLDLLDKDYDFIVGPYNLINQQKQYHFIPLGKYRFCLMVHKNHPLASFNQLSLSDLNQQTIRIMKEGNSPINDQIRHDILNHYPSITIKDIFPAYNTETFNKCALSQDFLLSLECWTNIHPSLKAISLKEDYFLPYGIVCKRNSSQKMEEFLSTIEKILSKL